MGRLGQKVALITGAAGGIGKQIANTFAREGADIVAADMVEMQEVSKEIESLGRKVLALRTDVSKKGEVQNLVEKAIGTFARIDILINNAGIIRPSTILDMGEEDWDLVLNVNLKGVFFCTQAIARHMTKRKYGKIVNIASTAGLNAVSGPIANYGPSKAGVVQLTKISAREFGPYGINVNAIAPGPVVTRLHYRGRTSAEVDKYMEESKRAAVLGRVGTPQDIANVALFLASDESSLITGQIIAADGGKNGLM